MRGNSNNSPLFSSVLTGQLVPFLFKGPRKDLQSKSLAREKTSNRSREDLYHPRSEGAVKRLLQKEILRKCFKKWSKIEHSRRIMSKRRSTKNELVVRPKLATRAVIRIGFFLYDPDAAGCKPSYLRPAVLIVLVSPTKKRKHLFACAT